MYVPATPEVLGTPHSPVAELQAHHTQNETA